MTRSGPLLVALDLGTGSVRAHRASLLDGERLYRITGRNLDPEIFLAKSPHYSRTQLANNAG